MSHARCPACLTVFRVHPEQMEARGGRVRCGHCFRPFNAHEHLLDSTPPSGTSTDDVVPRTAPAFSSLDAPAPPEPKMPAPAPQRPATHDSERPPSAAEVDALLEFTIPDSFAPERTPPPAPARSADDASLDWDDPFPERRLRPGEESLPSFEDRLAALTVRDEDEAADTDDPAAAAFPDIEPGWGGAEPLPTHIDKYRDEHRDEDAENAVRQADSADNLSAQAPSTPLPAAIRRRRSAIEADEEGIADDAGAVAQETEYGSDLAMSATPAASHESDDRPRFTPVIPRHEETDEPAETDAADFVDTGSDTAHAYAAPNAVSTTSPSTPTFDDAFLAPRNERRGLWALAIGVLLGVLTIQGLYLFREPVTRLVPELRPVFEQACAQIGCTVPLPRHAEAIAIDHSHLEAVRPHEAVFVLEARVHNRAAYPQQLPHLELTLTGAGERPLVRRVLEPAEWLSDASPAATAFAAHEAIDVVLPFAAADVDEPTGYRLYAFYP